MLAYIIDGFNLIYQIKGLKALINPHIGLIDYIRNNKLSGSYNNQVVIVFDGAPNLEAIQRRGKFELLFSNQGSADDLIVNRIRKIKNKKQVVMVSNDRQLRDLVRSLGAGVCWVKDFIFSKKRIVEKEENEKDISPELKDEITQEMRKIWLKE